ncbi:D-xylulose kinase-like protein [Phaeosphaeriaceae sp. PMI808]|nr:D-xylulose kinase-like protein [Phaeosphaeriaceae sp. PMI808]
MTDQYLGFDLSTQQLKGIVVGSDLKLIHEAKVDFDTDFSKYGIHKGVLTNPAEGEVFAPTALFLEAIDLVLQRLKDQGTDLSKVQGVSGAGMQHGTVFWSKDAESLLANLDAGKTLVEQLGDAKGEKKSAFSHPFSPNWQDASTQKQCEGFNAALNGPENLADATGSSAHHRFSGPQIQRFREKYPEAYAATSRISLVSSFVASIFLGKVAPIDISDVCGANLWDIKNGKWQEDLVALAAGGPPGLEDLKAKLGDVPQDGGASFGTISPYFSKRYGFPTSTQIIAFTGDNPSTILALPLHTSDAIVSLGTSTTFLMKLHVHALLQKRRPRPRTHPRRNQRIHHHLPPQSWHTFNQKALETPPLGQTSPAAPIRLALYFPRPEIVPNVAAGTWRYTYHDNTLSPVPENGDATWPVPDADARAILESQFLSLRLRSQALVNPQGALPAQPRRIYMVGGGAVNPAIAELAGQVLGGSEGVYKLEIGGNACALGAAYKAAWGVGRSEGESFEGFLEGRWDEEGFVKRICEGYRKGVWEGYGEALKGFGEVEGVAVREKGH